MTDWTVLDRAAAALTGNVGLFVARDDGTMLYERDADRLYPAASVIEIPILMTVYADAAEGRLSLDERLAAGEHRPGTGVLGHVPGVVDRTIRDHATLMIIVSDNTSTNRLMERVGVERIAQRMGLRGHAAPAQDVRLQGSGAWLGQRRDPSGAGRAAVAVAARRAGR